MSEEDCIFCKIIDGQIPSYKVYENDSVLAFLDIFPLSYGHTARE
ncbi:MAG: HIT domain-containing protein [Promethearchaeota archaeon]